MRLNIAPLSWRKRREQEKTLKMVANKIYENWRMKNVEK